MKIADREIAHKLGKALFIKESDTSTPRKVAAFAGKARAMACECVIDEGATKVSVSKLSLKPPKRDAEVVPHHSPVRNL